jgi:hypothetical protein
MRNEIYPWLLMCLCFIGFVALVVFGYVSTFKRLRGFTSSVKNKLSSWEVFVSRTGLQWELKQPGAPNVNDNPVMKNLFGAEATNRTGRVFGTYSGYPVFVANMTRDRYHMNPSLMVTDQEYYTELQLTIQNRKAINLLVRKERQLTIDPPEAGARLLSEANVMGRLLQLPMQFAIGAGQNNLAFVESGIEVDADRLYLILELMCDLADELQRV